MSPQQRHCNIAEARARSVSEDSLTIWRSLDELCDMSANLDASKPDQLAELQRIWNGGISRRKLLRLLGASLALAGIGSLGGCSDKPSDARIVPYVNQPEAMVPGKPLYIATTMPWHGFGRGVIVATREGRPIKIEGNPEHPATVGGSDVFMQASILGLYDPDRSKTVTFAGEPRTWGGFWDALESRLASKRSARGTGLAIVSGLITSPTLSAQRAEFLRLYPLARWDQFDPIGSENADAGLRQAFGRALSMRYDLSRADIVVAFNSDFLFAEPGSTRYARDFIDKRRVRRQRKEMNRLYAIESTLTITGSMADHRLAIKPSAIPQIVAELASYCGIGPRPAGSGRYSEWLRLVAAELLQARGKGLVVAGESLPPATHALIHQINHFLGNIGTTAILSEPILETKPADSISELVADIRSHAVDTLLVLGENLAYSSAGDSGFREALEQLSTRQDEGGTLKNFTAHLGLHADETAFCCQWHLPESHYLESWGDLRAFDGTASIIQPAMQPLYETLSTHELLERILGRTDRSGYEIVRATWRQKTGLESEAFENWWRQSLQSGVIPGSQAPQVAANTSPEESAQAFETTGGYATDSLELFFVPDCTVWDGRFSNNAWLQELPKPFTKLVWSNAALIAPKTAERLGLVDDDVVSISVDRRSIDAPILILPGLPENTITLPFGYGRARAGRVGSKRGFDAYHLRSSRSWHQPNVSLQRTGKQLHLVTTRSHHAMSNLTHFSRDDARESLKPNAVVSTETPSKERELTNRKLVRVATLEQFQANEKIIADLGGEKEKRPLLSLYPGPEHGGWDYSKGYQWGMSVDMTACIGCNACVVACQAENNIPIVGPEEVDRQREMHWIRIDDYFAGSVDAPAIYHQPIPCMHCENAPCEYVCPPGATTHSAEGLNQMTYNRCVGTRYCSNNCPYKVRRFNFLGYSDAEKSEQRIMQRNPDVSVRTSGVMEKCTYCIQRIQRTRIQAEAAIVEFGERAKASTDEAQRQKIRDESNRIENGIINALETACQQSCPTRAIIFGSINNVAGQRTTVASLKQEPHDYSLLRELTTKPRTTYLARFSNPNPAVSAIERTLS